MSHPQIRAVLTSSYVEQLNLILETVGTPDEEVLAQMGSEKVSAGSCLALINQACAYMRTLAHHEPKDLATVLPQADPQGQSAFTS